ncbi:regulatory YrvL family protein [Sporosarcina sp. ACRSL]|uniref:YrvL family regulatory protein n=1 Tax=Sporosarcina sp. ACRSL TaxID=2918215 RepID=UPI001EF6AEFC|nr:YrvL family regulatory protein [Sporosarcina sp. ACRSL]MCG7344830.1 regulatory YrvL family protein [Sporosarcina sp. ACRSL]
MNKIKTVVICTSIVSIILLGITFFEYIFLRLLGFQYNSIGALLFFFVMYVFLEIPLTLITNAIPKAFKSIGIIQSSKGWLSFILNAGLTFALIELLDTFMVNVSITWQGSLIFALIAGLAGLILKEKDDEPPMIDSEEFEKIGNSFNPKK